MKNVFVPSYEINHKVIYKHFGEIFSNLTNISCGQHRISSFFVLGDYEYNFNTGISGTILTSRNRLHQETLLCQISFWSTMLTLGPFFFLKLWYSLAPKVCIESLSIGLGCRNPLYLTLNNILHFKSSYENIMKKWIQYNSNLVY